MTGATFFGMTLRDACQQDEGNKQPPFERHVTMRTIRIAVLSALTMIIGCAGAGEPTEEEGIESAEGAIVGGESSPATQNHVVYVMRLLNGTWIAAGTGTVIGPSHVLTARHITCDQSTAPGVLGTCVKERGPFGIYVGTSRPPAGAKPHYVASSVRKYVTGQQFIFSEERIEDVAVLVFPNAKIPATGGSYPSIAGQSEFPSAGKTAELVGWGHLGNPSQPALVRQRKVVDVKQVFTGGEGTKARSSMILGAGQCPGDSGAPYFVPGTKKIVGVVSNGNNSVCHYPARATYLKGPIAAWLQASFVGK